MAPPELRTGETSEFEGKHPHIRNNKRKHKGKLKRKTEEEEQEGEDQAINDTSSAGEDITNPREAAREDIVKQQELRRERFSLMFNEYQEIIDQMDRSLEKAEAANERYQKVLRLLDEQCNRSFQGYEKLAQTARSTIPPHCELPLRRGLAESEPLTAIRKNSNGVAGVAKFPKRLSTCNAAAVERPLASSPDALKPLEGSPAKSDSSSASSRSCSSVQATPPLVCKAVVKKPPPFVPRLDLSGTVANERKGVEASSSSSLQRKLPPLQCDQFENLSRRTSRRTESARLISADDHFGYGNDSARLMLSRIKRRAKGGSCGGEAISESHVTCAASDTDGIVKKPSDDQGQQGEGPSIREIVNTALVQCAPENVGILNTREDVAYQTPEHELPRLRSPPVAMTSNPALDISGTCNAAACALKAQEVVIGDAVNLLTLRQETRTQILLWSTKEKLSTLQTLNNTMFLWEDLPAKCEARTSDEHLDLVLSSLTAAKDSQRRLFDNLDGVPGVPRCATCGSAVRELVRAYPPERLVPTSFINDRFVSQFVHHTVIDESFLKLVSAQTLRSAQDSEAAEFWQALVHHVVSVADHKMTTAEQSANEYAQVLLPEMREADIVGDAKVARLKLKAFLTRVFRPQTLPSGQEPDTPDSSLLFIDRAGTPAEGSPASRSHKMATSGQPVRDIVVTRGQSTTSNLPLGASKHTRRSSLSSIFHSLQFWKRRPQKSATDMDDWRSTDRPLRPQTTTTTTTTTCSGSLHWRKRGTPYLLH